MNITYKAQVSIFVVIALLIVGSIILMVTVRTNTVTIIPSANKATLDSDEPTAR